MANVLSIIDFLMNKIRRPLDHNLDFRPTQTSFKSLSPSSNSNHLILQQLLNFDHNLKNREAKLLISCNLIGGNQQPLDLRP